MGLGAGALVDLAHACHGVLSDVRTPSAFLFGGVHRTTAGRQGEGGEACTAGLAHLKQGMMVHTKVVRNTLKTQHAKTHGLRPCSTPAQCCKRDSRLDKKGQGTLIHSQGTRR